MPTQRPVYATRTLHGRITSWRWRCPRCFFASGPVPTRREAQQWWIRHKYNCDEYHPRSLEPKEL